MKRKNNNSLERETIPDTPHAIDGEWDKIHREATPYLGVCQCDKPGSDTRDGPNDSDGNGTRHVHVIMMIAIAINIPCSSLPFTDTTG